MEKKSVAINKNKREKQKEYDSFIIDRKIGRNYTDLKNLMNLEW